MISKYAKMALLVIIVVTQIWVIAFAKHAGYDKAMAEIAGAKEAAVEAAKKQWEKEHAADEKIVEYVTRTETEYVDRERIINQYITRWKSPPACADLGESFRLLFNGQTDSGSQTQANRAEFEAAVQAALAAAGFQTGDGVSNSNGQSDNPRSVHDSNGRSN